MSNSIANTKTPSEQLACKIFDVLVERKLMLSGDKSKLVDRLANGKLRAEDWRVAIEKAIDKEVKE